MNNNKLNILLIASLSIVLVIFMIGVFIFFSLRKKEVIIDTEPTGAHYKIGSIEGTTPANLRLRAGEYKIEFSNENYKTLEESFSIKLFEKNLSLTYTLESQPINPPQEAINHGFGGDPNWKENLESVEKKYSFYDELPVREYSFYISKPTYDDKFFAYIPKDDPEGGKFDVLKWFSQNGIAEPESLNIIWQYR